jgi:glycoside/pentoside/hexuronide:cation symporter, GPH family
MAGLPIYIHAPKFYVDEYGVSLAALGRCCSRCG